MYDSWVQTIYNDKFILNFSIELFRWTPFSHQSYEKYKLSDAKNSAPSCTQVVNDNKPDYTNSKKLNNNL